MFKDHDCFQLIKTLPNENIPIGTVGVVLMVLARSPFVYLVEFPDGKGGNLGVTDNTFTIIEEYMDKDSR